MSTQWSRKAVLCYVHAELSELMAAGAHNLARDLDDAHALTHLCPRQRTFSLSISTPFLKPRASVQTGVYLRPLPPPARRRRCRSWRRDESHGVRSWRFQRRRDGARSQVWAELAVSCSSQPVLATSHACQPHQRLVRRRTQDRVRRARPRVGRGPRHAQAHAHGGGPLARSQGQAGALCFLPARPSWARRARARVPTRVDTDL